MVFKKNHSNLTGEEIEEIAVKAIALTEMVHSCTCTCIHCMYIHTCTCIYNILQVIYIL